MTPNPHLRRIDTHFHANIQLRSRSARAKIASALLARIRHLDILCSTEHVYKDPLAAFDFLDSIVRGAGLPIDILPAVENISREGVELIQIAQTRQDLAALLREKPGYALTIEDLAEKGTVPFISILPHPYSPSKTGAVTGLGKDRAKRLFDRVDFIEAGNGAFFDLPRYVQHRPAMAEKIKNTETFPRAELPQSVGSSYGSDAHFPSELGLHCLLPVRPGETNFEALSKRPQMEAASSDETTNANKHLRLMANLGISGVEYLQKQVFRVVGAKTVRDPQ